MKLVIATHNVKKAGEMVTILSRRFPDLDILTLEDFDDAPEPEETGTTYAENAAIKAVSAAQYTGEWSLADDAGLEIDAMDGEPGLYSKRFAGEDTPFPQKMKVILDRLSETPEAGRTARFRCHIALASPGGEEVFGFEATCEGRIADAPSGKGGFGYDPIFWLPELGCTMADLTPDQKHAISHRGKVLGQFADFWAGKMEALMIDNPSSADELEPTDEAGSEVQADFEALSQQLATLIDERDQLQQQVLRTMADFQNFRKRNQEQALQLRQFATEQFVRDLLPVLDNFERTVRAAESGATAEALVEGVRAVERQLRTAIESQGVQRIVSVGEPFNPDHHEALGVEMTEEFAPDTVALEIEPGYKMADRVIRPARVKVAAKP